MEKRSAVIPTASKMLALHSTEYKIFLDKFIFRSYIIGMTMPTQTAVNFIEDVGSASKVLNPLRLQILERLREPDSAAGLSRQMNLPRQKINYHLRELEKHGLLEPVEERKRGNCVERIVRATARHYLINPAALGNLSTDPNEVQDRFSSTYLAAVAARTIRDVAVLRARAEKANKKLATFTLETNIKLDSAADLHDFAEDLTNAMTKLIAKYHNERVGRGRSFKFIIGSYPAITKKE